MNKFIFILFLTICLFTCQKQVKPIDIKIRPKISEKNSSDVDTERFKLSPFLKLDSVSNSDYFFKNEIVDSIIIRKMSFNATYIKCYKALVHDNIYSFLKKHNYTEYKNILAIHTRHLVLVNGVEYSFNGKGDIGCWSTIPESSFVSIESDVYSLFSNNIHLGKIVILESITPIE